MSDALQTTSRRRWMSILACAQPAALAAAWAQLRPVPAHVLLRAPESGLVMVRGRVGGSGARFNVGEMTVTRCVVQLDDGAVGHAWVQGRDGEHARTAALADALLQSAHWHELVYRSVIAPLSRQHEERRAARAQAAAATRVDFYTLARGEDT